jgi:chromosome segregation ATPase
MTNIKMETVVWDHSNPFIENVLKNIQNYVDAHAFRGGDKHRLNKMQELRSLAEAAKNEHHNFLAVQEKAKAMLKNDIKRYGIWGELGKESFSFKILSIISLATLSDPELQQQVTPSISDNVKQLRVEIESLQKEIDSSDAIDKKCSLLESAMQNKQEEVIALETKVNQVEQEKKSLVASNMLLQAENSRFIALKIDLNELQIVYQQLATDHKVLRTELAETKDLKIAKSELERKILRLEAEIKLLRNHINDQGQLDANTQEQLSAANAKVAQLQTRLAEQEHKLFVTQSKENTLLLQQSLLEAKASELKKQQAIQESEKGLVPILKEMVDTTAIDNAALRKQLKEKDAKIMELTAVNKANTDYYQGQVNTLQRDLKEHKKEISHLKALINSLMHFLRNAIGSVENSHAQGELTEGLKSLEKQLPSIAKSMPTRPLRYTKIAFIAGMQTTELALTTSSSEDAGPYARNTLK